MFRFLQLKLSTLCRQLESVLRWRALFFRFRGEPVRDDQEILICLQSYHYTNFRDFFGFSLDEVAANMKPRIIATSLLGVLEELFSTRSGLDARVEGRLVVLD